MKQRAHIIFGPSITIEKEGHAYGDVIWSRLRTHIRAFLQLFNKLWKWDVTMHSSTTLWGKQSSSKKYHDMFNMRMQLRTKERVQSNSWHKQLPKSEIERTHHIISWIFVTFKCLRRHLLATARLGVSNQASIESPFDELKYLLLTFKVAFSSRKNGILEITFASKGPLMRCGHARDWAARKGSTQIHVTFLERFVHILWIDRPFASKGTIGQSIVCIVLF